MFSMARRFSIPMSHAMPDYQLCKSQREVSLPNGSAGEGARLSLRIGIRAFGNGLTTKFVS